MKKLTQNTGSITISSALLCWLLALSGCDQGPELVPVTGSVVFKGKLLEYGSVMFQPVGVENALTARSKIAADGTFSMSTTKPGDGVMAGKCQVRITAFDAQRTNAKGNQQQELALGKSAVPRRFQNFGESGIVIEVSPDMELPLTIDLDEFE